MKKVLNILVLGLFTCVMSVVVVSILQNIVYINYIDNTGERLNYE